MAQVNPLLGSRISLISKKNIRYEGLLYSINESDATVALQDVRSYGTEGREKLDNSGSTTFVPPQDAVHAYLLFRGCDIKDLHVHEQPSTSELPADPAILSSTAPGKAKPEKETRQQQQPREGGSSTRRGTRKQNPAQHAKVGTGASLLNRKARGAVGGGMETPSDDFDFASNLAEFDKEEDDDDEDDEAFGESGGGTSAYTKDDFFDSISCDALDKQSGIDRRLRGRQERTLNTETFGAIALNGQRRGRRYRGRGSGRGRGRSGRGGRGRGPRPRPRENNRWQREDSYGAGGSQRTSQGSGGGGSGQAQTAPAWS